MLYLDPSAGSMGFQMIVGGLLAAAGVVRLYWRRVKGLLSPQLMERRVENGQTFLVRPPAVVGR